MKNLKLSVAVVVLLLLFIFSTYNSQPVRIRFTGWQSGDLPLFLLILFSFLCGFLVAWLLGTIRSSQLRREIQALRRDASIGRQPPGSAADDHRASERNA
ncbi:MAG: LapA family protein [Desulfuromonadales bacterium]|jgi:uncharacterized integral membrane protein